MVGWWAAARYAVMSAEMSAEMGAEMGAEMSACRVVDAEKMRMPNTVIAS